MQAPFELIQVFDDPSSGFRGNTSAVVQLPQHIKDESMQRLAADLNQPATTYLWESDGKWHIRWFAPDGEIGLCGHGSLAAVAYLSRRVGDGSPFSLHYRDGIIRGGSNKDRFQLILDPIPVEREESPLPVLKDGLGVPVIEYYITGNKDIVVTENESQVAGCKPDFSVLKNYPRFGFILTAEGKETDFVSRTFVPHVGQLEDPATGSSHAVLTPFWSDRLKKNDLSAHQLSARKGKFRCQYQNGEVTLEGSATILATGEVTVL